MKTVVTITGIRPDFIRMSELFRRLDEKFHHVLIHTGQHYDKMLSDVFFDELEIRKPDYNLGIGAEGKEHFHQTADVSVKTIEILRESGIKPDIILFLGDSNSVVVSVPLRKEGYRIGHIEAGMRSGDRRMLEETNRTVCDHCSDVHFVYHPDYKENLVRENLPAGSIHVVGNTIVEVCNKFKGEIMSRPKTKDFILMDIHRPENFKYSDRLRNVFWFANHCIEYFKVPVKMLRFGRTMKSIESFRINTGDVEFVDLMSYKDFLRAQYNCRFMISDSGTAQEEPALLNTPVIVPRDYTERPQSCWSNCSIMLMMLGDKLDIRAVNWIDWVEKGIVKIDPSWLGDGTTSQKICNILENTL